MKKAFCPLLPAVVLAWFPVGAGDPEKQAEEVLLMAKTALHQRDYTQARDLFEQAFRLFRELGSPLGQWEAAFYIGECSRRLYDLGPAIEWYGRALELVPTDSPELAARTHMALGLSYLAVGLHHSAIPHLEEAVRVFEEVGLPEALAEALLYLGSSRCELGDYQVAIEYLELSSRIFRELEEYLGCARALMLLGECRYRQGDYRGAIAHFREALELLWAMGYRWGEARALAALGLCYCDIGEYEYALKALTSSMAIYVEVYDEKGLAEVSVWLGDCYRGLGRYPEALESYSRALSVYREIGHRWGSFLVLLRIAGLGSVLGPFREVIARYKEALEEVEGFPAPTPELTRARKSLYDTIIGCSPPEEALLYAERAKERDWVDMLEGAFLSRPEALPEGFRPLRYAFLKLIGLYRALPVPGLNLERPAATPGFVSMLKEAEGEYRALLSRVLEGR